MDYASREPVLKPFVKGLPFQTNKKQAAKVFDLLIKRLEEKGVPYNYALVPQADQLLPEAIRDNPKQRAIYLFALCLWMRGGVQSNTAAKALREMYETVPHLFDTAYYEDKGMEHTRKVIEEVVTAFTKHRLAQRIGENSEGWVYNMRKLGKFWGGDPRNLMNDKPDFDVLVKRIMGKTRKDGEEGKEFFNEDKPEGFMYFREKMVAMIAYFLMDTGLVPLFYTPVPIDFHVFRLLVANRIIVVKGYTEKESIGVDFYNERTKALARDITLWYCKLRKVSPVALCDALWLLSGNLCRNNPGNSGCVFDEKRKAAARLKKSRRFEDVVHFNFHTEVLSERPVALTLAPVVPTVTVDITLTPVASTTPVKPSELPEDSLEGFNLDDPVEDISGRKRYRGPRYSTTELLQSRKHVARIEETCGRCPLQDTCRFNITSGFYYVGGKLVPERHRVSPPEVSDLFRGDSTTQSANPPIDPRVRFAKIRVE